ncbi:Hypothetical predicted protein [Mytilus galloprovincialis]|uniref:Uncharacterized protein n=1 Tax=Mytilus galloprovincialis TaxID=29158 RepID=A0A8B6G3D1_MYTGA|nr:Hypothetical predicted protein [Mytilus galloprovincialis]
MPCKTKKELLMSNSHNKQALINIPCDKLKDNEIRCRCKNVTDNANLLIEQTAMDCAVSLEVVVNGEDKVLDTTVSKTATPNDVSEEKNGLQCSVGCDECRGLYWFNSVPIAKSDFMDE